MEEWINKENVLDLIKLFLSKQTLIEKEIRKNFSVLNLIIFIFMSSSLKIFIRKEVSFKREPF